MLCVFILLHLVQNVIHQKIIKDIIKNDVLLLFWGFKMQIRMIFRVLEIVIWRWKSFRNCLKEFVRTLFKGMQGIDSSRIVILDDIYILLRNKHVYALFRYSYFVI